MEEASGGSKDYSIAPRRDTPVQLKGVAMSFGFRPRKSLQQPPTSNRPIHTIKENKPSDYLDTKKDAGSKYTVNRFGFRQVLPTNRYDNDYPTTTTNINNGNNNNNVTTVVKTKGLRQPQLQKATYVSTDDSNRNRVFVKSNPPSRNITPERVTSHYTQMPKLQPITTMNIMDSKVAKTLMNTNKRIASNNSYRPVYSTNSTSSYKKLLETPKTQPKPQISSIINNDNKQTHKFKSDKLFIKTQTQPIVSNLLNNSSDDSIIDDCEWMNAGEAMADEVSLYLSPEKKPQPKKNLSLNMKEKSEIKNKNLLLEDPKFAAVAAIAASTSSILLDEEPSPVESLISTSESDELFKKKKNKSQSESKEINEKLTPSPGTPTNISMSLSDGKDDFLIDDEIADQPELIFENPPPAMKYCDQNDIVNIIKPQTPKFVKRSPKKLDLNTLTALKKKDVSTRTGSLDTLSPCDSLASDDLMMDFDALSDLDDCDRNDCDQGTRENTPKIQQRHYMDKSVDDEIVLSDNEQKPWIKSESRLSFLKKATSSPTNSLVRYSKINNNIDSEHIAMKKEISNIKSMLFELRRVLNESETQLALESYSDNSIMSMSEHSENSEIQLEINEMKRQILFLQGQLEDREDNLKQMKDTMAKINKENVPRNFLEPLDLDNTCNAATQTERVRPLSSSLTLIESPTIEDNMESLVRFQAENGNSSVEYVSSIVHTTCEDGGKKVGRFQTDAKSLGFNFKS